MIASYHQELSAGWGQNASVNGMSTLPQNTLILTSEPFIGFMPVDLRAWIETHNNDRDLATAFAEVHNHVGLLGHELDETEDLWLVYAFEAWWEVEQELYNIIYASMRRSNACGKTSYNLQTEGLYYLVKPFMEASGYQDGAGWWIRSDEKLQGPAILIGL